MARIFIGIDPGVTGAVALFAPGEKAIQIVDTPVVTVRNTRRDFVLSDMAKLFEGLESEECLVALEDVHPMPREGVASAGAFMRGVGLWEGILAALHISCIKVPPQVWKRELGVSMPPATPKKRARVKLSRAAQKIQDKFDEAERRRRSTAQKARAILIAQRLFPGVDLPRKKDHGRADAILLAEYARRKSEGQSSPPLGYPMGPRRSILEDSPPVDPRSRRPE